jgi:hypothetical protein
MTSADLRRAAAYPAASPIAFSQGAGTSIDFRADIFDLRKSGLMELVGRIASAGIIHKMELHGAFCGGDPGGSSASSGAESHVMHEANRATKGECCRDPMGRLTGLVGTPLGEGFAAELKKRFGGPLGCTHVSTLFQELSAFVALFARRAPRESRTFPPSASPASASRRRSVFFDALPARTTRSDDPDPRASHRISSSPRARRATASTMLAPRRGARRRRRRALGPGSSGRSRGRERSTTGFDLAIRPARRPGNRATTTLRRVRRPRRCTGRIMRALPRALLRSAKRTRVCFPPC